MPKRPEISVADFAKTVEMEPIAVIPHDAKLFGAAANNGQMIAEIEPKGKIAETVRRSRRRDRRAAPRRARPSAALLDPLSGETGGQEEHERRTRAAPGATGSR